MTVWTVWEHDRFEGDERAVSARFVRDGFSLLAFLFGPLWALANGMVLVALGYLAVVAGATTLASSYVGPSMAFWTSLVLAVWFGFEARNLKRWALARRGWQLAGVVEGKRFVAAERRWFREREAPRGEVVRAAAVPGVVPRVGPWQDPSDVIGVMPESPR